jgi:hypothetical protein
MSSEILIPMMPASDKLPVEDPSLPADDSDLQPIVLDFQDGGRKVVVSPKDQDRFVVTSQMAAEACKQAQNFREWNVQFRQMLNDVRLWAEGCGASIQTCYVAVHDGHLVIFVSADHDHYDQTLSDRLTDLDLEIAGKHPLVRCDVLQVPGGSLERLAIFFNPAEAFLIYGNDGRTPREVAPQQEVPGCNS